ncbi:MAG TPA: carboxypeptidase-like regulatory domain-containing protein [Pyrinomonadaceae bacterium]|nr:carboxypeptidase-like regulatory domain-containing protein [Pyrinomonadaceae bacterium]
MKLKSINLIAAFIWLAAAIVSSIQAQEPVPAKNPGSISGRITVDGKPKAGLVVELLATDTNGPRRPIAKATTSKTGKYVLTNVESGTYDVSPTAPTLVVPNQGRAGQSGISLTIEAGERLKGIDFDLISKGSIRGRVRDLSGEPVKGQTVELILRGADNYSRPFYPSAPDELKTNAEGAYRISGVPPGRYILKVGVAFGLAAFGGSEKGHVYYPETFYPSADEESKATVVEVTAGRETPDIDITVNNPLKIYEIVGQLIADETGAPVPNVNLEIITTSATGGRSSHLGGAFKSNANGEFRIPNASPGHYVVAAANDPVSNTYGDPVSFDVKDEDVTGLRIPMHSASIMTGVVTIEGSVDPAIGNMPPMLMITAATLSTELMGSSVTANVNPDGGFRLTGIRPGKVSLSSFIHRGKPGPLRILRIERNGIELRDSIDVRPGEDISGLRLVLGSGSSVLRGEVKIEGGPLVGVDLSVLYRSINGDAQRFYRAELDARGHFVIKGLIPGEYELTIGPMSVEISGEGGSRMMNRMPTVKQNVVVGAGADAFVTLVMTLKPEN